MDFSRHEDMEEEGFWFEIQEISGAINEIVHKYGYEDRVLSSIVVGLLSPVDENYSNMKAFFHHNLDNEVEVDAIAQFMKESYEAQSKDQGPDLNDLLDGLGISLN